MPSFQERDGGGLSLVHLVFLQDFPLLRLARVWDTREQPLTTLLVFFLLIWPCARLTPHFHLYHPVHMPDGPLPVLWVPAWGGEGGACAVCACAPLGC